LTSWRLVGNVSVFILFAIVAFVSVLGSLGGPDRVALAQPGSDTYLLSDFDIQYPYLAPRPESSGTSQAVVYYKSYWSGTNFPGLVKCEITVEDGKGEVVGSIQFDLSSASPELPERIASAPIDVTSPPSAASGGCEAGTYSSESSYQFTKPSFSRPTDLTTGQPSRDRVLVSFGVTWTGSHPSMRSCVVDVEFSDGSTRSLGPFELHLSNSQPYEIEVSADEVADVRDARVECRPI